MPTYNLNLALNSQELELFYATGSNIVIAKPTEGGQPNVAWQVFRPLEANRVEWEENYGIYASTASIHNGARLTQLSRSEFPANEGMVYTLDRSGAFTPPAPGGQSGAFTARNDYEESYLTFGLFQHAVVNGQQVPGNAISAAPVLHESTASMTPYTTLYAWVQSEVKSNSVVTHVTSPQTQVKFGGDVTEVSVRYDLQAGAFVAGGDLPEGAGVSASLPTVH